MIKFGTGGWRAVIGDDFTRENIEKVAAGLCEIMLRDGTADKPVIIGYDRRFLSQAASRWFADVLVSYGIDVKIMKRSAPTPLVMYIVKAENLHYGVEITASHNPAEYDGIKIIVEEGRDAPASFTDRLEGVIERRIRSEKPEVPGSIEVLKTPFNGFLDSILSRLDLEAIKNSGIRVLFDSMHGSATYALMTVLCTARCTLDTINTNKDAFFGGANPAPAAELLGQLRNLVTSEKYDLGIAVDGDGDRVGIVDPSGAYLSANQILVMLYGYLHEYKGWKGPVVRNLATTHMLDKLAASFGEECYEVPVGFKYISSKMDEVDAVLGGESSGGLTVRGHINGKDSIYAASLFVEMLAVTGKTPCEIWNEYVKQFGSHVMCESNLKFAPEDKPRINNLIMTEKKLPVFPKEVERVNYEDGCKVYFKDSSFVICRFSGTEPLLRIFAESESAEMSEQLISCMKDFCL
ncbi:MAG: phosphoglucomutase/phosphomannomutase family protein [Clostridia bacterium]|nr:phosphoglucomutase/phosphomannomutase family protein [Clostridia bacterium]